MDDQAGVTYQFDLVEFYFEQHTGAPHTDPVHGRPFEFDDETGKATKYATTCPNCSQGNFIESDNIYEYEGKHFVKCESCGVGENETQEKLETLTFEDPFQNPIKEGIIKVSAILDEEVEEEDEEVTLADRLQGVDVEKDLHDEIEQANDDDSLTQDEENYLDELLEQEFDEE